MNINVTTKEEILRNCRKIVAEKGLSGLNMRKVAAECGVALGSLYNYFSSKDELLIATVESVWNDIFSGFDSGQTQFDSFPDCVANLFARARAGSVVYPRFFADHSLIFSGAARSDARRLMEGCFTILKRGLTDCLRADSSVSPSAFSDDFRSDDFIEFVFSAFVLALAQNKRIDFLVEVIRRTIY